MKKPPWRWIPALVLVLLGGDICDDVIPHNNTEALLRGIAGRYPCYYVTGNHEFWSRDIGTILTLFLSYGVTVLSGDCETISVRGQQLNLCGVDDPAVTSYTNSAFGTAQQLKALQHADANGLYTVLLAHRPELVVVDLKPKA